MKVLNLSCSHQHSFEGWFASEDDFQSQMSRQLLECPLCGDRVIRRMPCAPRLQISKARAPEAPSQQTIKVEPDALASAPQPVTPQGLWLKAVQHIMANTDDVGLRFAEEARRMHYGEIEVRAIRGQATLDDAHALHEEGIEVMALPVPASAKETLQ